MESGHSSAFRSGVVAKCANSNCDEPFIYFRSGKLFQFPKRQRPYPSIGQMEAFWLCGDCARDFTLDWTEEGMRVVRRAEEALASD
jgi:hypothetical protein